MFFKKFEKYFWPEVLLCTLMWNISFFMVDKTTSLGILGLAAASILVYAQMISKIWLWIPKPVISGTKAGLAWGAGCFGIQTFWAADVFTRYIDNYGVKCLIVFVFAFVFFTLIGAAFSTLSILLCKAVDWILINLLCIYEKLFRHLALTLVVLSFSPSLFLYFDKVCFWPSCSMLGYPFFSPLIPLSSSETFINFVKKIRGHDKDSAPKHQNFNFHWIEPRAYKHNLIHNKGKSFNPEIAAKQIARAIEASSRKFLKNQSDDQKLLILAPESSFPFKINEFPEIVELWSSKLKPKQFLALGTYRSEENKIFQTTCFIGQNGIINFCDKKRLTPFAESKYSLAASKEPNKAVLDENLTVIPLICFEFFIDSASVKTAQNQNEIPIIFANDSWFPKYFKTILRNQARLASAWYGKELFYLSHFFELCISPFSGSLINIDPE